MIHSSQKSVATSLCRLGGLFLVFVAIGACPAGAGVRLAPGGAIIFASSESKAGPITDTHSASAPGYALWTAIVQSVATHTATSSHANGSTSLLTSFDEATFAVTSNGVGTAGNGGTVAGGALVAVFFFVDTVQTFNANSYMIPHTYPNHLQAFVANVSHGQTTVIPLVAGPGNWNASGRLPPGAYIFYMQNHFGPESDNGECTTFGTGVGFTSVTDPLINRQPGDVTVQIHEVASFSVGTSGPAPTSKSGSGAMTFQWRKGLQNLSDGGRISGTQTSELTIADAAVSDSGLYDCVVTQGAVVEPSSLVHLTVNDEGPTDVPPMGAATGLMLAVPYPSPFRESTQIRFSIPRAAETSLDVLDVNGRRVRQLLNRGPLEAGAQSVTWDGRDEGGARTPAGVYFMRLASGREQVVQRVVSLGGRR